jgi:hypothetical protein
LASGQLNSICLMSFAMLRVCIPFSSLCLIQPHFQTSAFCQTIPFLSFVEQNLVYSSLPNFCFICL